MLHFHYVNDAGKRIAAAIEQEQIPFDGEAIIFIGALGICVRKILPMVSDKYTDPAVVCIDSTGRYVIPVLSGHMGGANRLSRRIAMILGAEAVITTQSDNMGLWSLPRLPLDDDAYVSSGSQRCHCCLRQSAPHSFGHRVGRRGHTPSPRDMSSPRDALLFSLRDGEPKPRGRCPFRPHHHCLSPSTCRLAHRSPHSLHPSLSPSWCRMSEDGT